MDKNTGTLKEMVTWLREDFRNFETKHDVVHACLDQKVDGLRNFKWKVLGMGAAFGTVGAIIFAIVINFDTIKKSLLGG